MDMYHSFSKTLNKTRTGHTCVLWGAPACSCAVRTLLQAFDFVREYPRAAMVTVIGVQGSTPRHVGTHMLVSDSGQQRGTIGGGRVEMEAVIAAQDIAIHGNPMVIKHHLVKDLGMCCGGSMELYIEPLAPCLPVLREVLAACAAGHRCLLETPLGAKAPHRDKVCTVLGEGEVPKSTDSTCFREVLCASQRVILFGCGHLSRAIGPLAQSLEYEVVLCDDNETGAIDGAYSWASTVVSSFGLRDIETAIGRLGHRDHLLILTRDHAIDQKIAEVFLPRIEQLGYLGLIGSQGKIGRFRKRILAKGLVGQEQWQRLRAPIGLDIGAETPSEIAVSIMAELVALRHHKGGKP